MATHDQHAIRAADLPGKERRRAIAGIPADSISLDWAMAICTCIITFGLFIDGWAHNHDKVDDTFFTPWHALLYGSIAAAGLLLIYTHFRNVGRGHRWRQALPNGYGLSLAGFFIFAAGGVADLFWHETFGFEEGLEALLSPSHLLLAVSGLMIMTGPIRAMWRRADTEQSWRGLLPAILPFACITSVFTFFTTFAAVSSEFIALTGARPADHTLTDIFGIVALVMHANILLAVVLVHGAALAAALRRGDPALCRQLALDDLDARTRGGRFHLRHQRRGGRPAGRLAAAA